MWLRVASGPRVKLAVRKIALDPTVFFSTDRSVAVVAVSLTRCFVVYFARRFVLCLALCYFARVCFLSFYHCDFLAWGRESLSFS